jgi:predicted flap endonuclease-1-like 5' DNA nuclease
MMEAKERLLLTADKARLVRDGDPEGVLLYCTPGTFIPDSAVERFGLIDGRLPDGAADAGTKEAPPRPDKEQTPGQDKEKKPDGDKGAGGGTKGAAAPGTDELTLVKGVGPKVAAALAKAGITTFAQLAAINPASPPEIEGLGVRTNWSAIVASAIELYEDGDSQQGGDPASGVDGAAAGAADQGGN